MTGQDDDDSDSSGPPPLRKEESSDEENEEAPRLQASYAAGSIRVQAGSVIADSGCRSAVGGEEWHARR